MGEARPPLAARLLIRCLLDRSTAEFALGDIEEEFADMATRQGTRRARRWYWKQAFLARRRAADRGPRRVSGGHQSLMASVAGDVRLGARTYAGTPGFTATTLLVLALGIGVTTGVYSIADWLWLRPVPGVEAPEQLAFVTLGSGFDTGGIEVGTMLSYPNMVDLAERLETVAAIAGFSTTNVNASVSGTSAVELPVEFTTASYARTLGLGLSMGRWFDDEEDDPAAPQHVAVIGNDLWQRMFAGDPDVLGRELLVNGRPFRVVGVVEAGFAGPLLQGATGAWLPGASFPWANHDERMDFTRRDEGLYYEFVVRAGPGAKWPAVETELRSAATWLGERYPNDNERFVATPEREPVTFGLAPGIGIRAWDRPQFIPALRLMLVVGGLVLLIACANVANLLLLRGLCRESETAIRTALGASRARLLRQQVAETVVLWVLAGVLGLVAALALTRVFAGVALIESAVIQAAPIDLRVFGFSIGVSLVAGILFSLLPAWATSGAEPARFLPAGGPASPRQARLLRTGFGALQLAASLVLLVGALLFVQTSANLAHVEIGFDPDGIAAATFYPNDIGYTVQESVEYFERLVQTLGATSGIQQVSHASTAPFYGFEQFGRAGRSGSEELVRAWGTFVDHRFFDTLGIPVTRGRTFTPEEDRGEQMAIVINETLAATLFPGGDPVGQTVDVALFGTTSTKLVTGVVGDTRGQNLTGTSMPFYYLPIGRGAGASRGVVLVRAASVGEAERALRTAAAAANPLLAPRRVAALDQAVALATEQPRLLARLLTILAVVAIVLATVGVYGIVASVSSRRTAEFGIRIALGSTPSRILALVCRSALSLWIIGLLGGMVGAWWLSRLMEAHLYGVEALDPASWVGAIVLLSVAVWGASLMPARHASRLDPVDLLRAR